MAIHITYTNAKSQFARLWDEVINNNEVAIIKRRGAEDVAMISATELAGLIETSHLLCSPKNAERLLTALEKVRGKKGKLQSDV